MNRSTAVIVAIVRLLFPCRSLTERAAAKTRERMNETMKVALRMVLSRLESSTGHGRRTVVKKFLNAGIDAEEGRL